MPAAADLSIAASLLLLLPGAPKPEKHTGVVEANTVRFADLGYRVKEEGRREPTAWEKSELGIRAVRFWQLRSFAPLSRDPKEWASRVWYRFVVTQEDYETEDAAKARLPRLLALPPGMRIDDQKSFVLRDAFHVENRVIVVSTDVVMFETEMKRLLTRLREQPPE
jgi:hypothetical protein